MICQDLLSNFNQQPSIFKFRKNRDYITELDYGCMLISFKNIQGELHKLIEKNTLTFSHALFQKILLTPPEENIDSIQILFIIEELLNDDLSNVRIYVEIKGESN